MPTWSFGKDHFFLPEFLLLTLERQAGLELTSPTGGAGCKMQLQKMLKCLQEDVTSRRHQRSPLFFFFVF